MKPYNFIYFFYVKRLAAGVLKQVQTHRRSKRTPILLDNGKRVQIVGATAFFKATNTSSTMINENIIPVRLVKL